MSAHRVGLPSESVASLLAALADVADPTRPIVLHMTPEALRSLDVRRVPLRRRFRLFGRWRR